MVGWFHPPRVLHRISHCETASEKKAPFARIMPPLFCFFSSSGALDCIMEVSQRIISAMDYEFLPCSTEISRKVSFFLSLGHILRVEIFPFALFPPLPLSLKRRNEMPKLVQSGFLYKFLFNLCEHLDNMYSFRFFFSYCFPLLAWPILETANTFF